jgi:hypothetical protein
METDKTQKRLAIIGAGSGGLVTLKLALEQLPDLEVCCFEKTSSTQGAWGKTYEGFVSTSTKYTTQFSCHRKFDSSVRDGADQEYHEFFRDNEYGDYLQSFVEENNLGDFIYKNYDVQKVARKESKWELSMLREGEEDVQSFDYLVISTGLAEKPKAIQSPVKTLLSFDDKKLIRGKKIVVIGGGESATDIANRLASPELENQIYLSLKTGIRVSPRYHPIRGVPSDFLRNRFLISIHENIRNAVGQKFVEARIKHQEKFERFFRSKSKMKESGSLADKRKHWDTKLTKRAKGHLFNMFHNKSDAFLGAVAEDRIRIIGKNINDSYDNYFDFDNEEEIKVCPDYLVPMIGYESHILEISEGTIQVKDFFLGCQHVDYGNLFLVGFARPIIGNIPSISEIQARYIVGIIGGQYQRSSKIKEEHAFDRDLLTRRYPKLNTDQMYPVDMVPYCNRLAKKMGTYPSLKKLKSLRRWIKVSLSPFSTMHYVDEDFDGDYIDAQSVYSPLIITLLLVVIKVFDIPYTKIKNITASENKNH